MDYLKLHKYVVLEIDLMTGEWVRTYLLYSTDSEWKYIDMVSLSCFFESIKRRNRNPNRLFMLKIAKEELEFYLNPQTTILSKDLVNFLESNTPVVCKDIWDFYRKIGYNYKTKKYSIV